MHRFLPKHTVSYCASLLFALASAYLNDGANRDILSHLACSMASIDQLNPSNHDTYTYHFFANGVKYTGISSERNAFNASYERVNPTIGQKVIIFYSSKDPWHSKTSDPKERDINGYISTFIMSLVFSLFMLSVFEFFVAEAVRLIKGV
jgi:hypothetical protein